MPRSPKVPPDENVKDEKEQKVEKRHLKKEWSVAKVAIAVMVLILVVALALIN